MRRWVFVARAAITTVRSNCSNGCNSNSTRDDRRDPVTRRFNQTPRTQSKSSSINAGNARGQPSRATGVDVTKIPTERQTEAFQRNCDTFSETKKKPQTTQRQILRMIVQTKRNSQKMFSGCARRERRRSRRRRTSRPGQ